jgi:DNA-binding beta-propeller fold protein YncE
MRRAFLRIVLPPATAIVFVASAPAADRLVPGKLPSGEIQLPNGRLLTPTGTQTEVSPYPFALALTPDGRRVVVACTGADDQSLHLLDAVTGKHLAKQPLEHSWFGLALSPDGARAYVAGAKGGNVLVYRLDADRFFAEESISLKRKEDAPNLDATPGGLAISPDGATLWAARILADDLVKIDLRAKEVVAAVPAGVHPYRPVFSPDGKLLAVAAWGGATVTFIDPEKAASAGSVKTADHPGDLVFSPDAKALFVAQANRNLVAVVDVASRAVVRQVSIAFGPDGPGTKSAEDLPDGSTPNALALSRDGRTLFVANADDDAIAVVDVPSDVAKIRARGFIPSGWYPDALALSRNGRALWAANAKGGGSWENAKGGPDPTKPKNGNPTRLTRTLPGSISRIFVPSAKELAALTARAYANRRPAARGASPAGASVVVPAAPGGVSPIKHVVYVIRENRTYDQVLGDLPNGNGDPSLVLFGREVTPNAHALAEHYVTLDNFYCDAEVSADGHNWSMGAYATDFVEKIWPPNYGSHGFSYLFEGNDPAAYPTNGYLWDAAARAGLSLRNYGEFTGIAAETEAASQGAPVKGQEGALDGNTCPSYPGFDTEILDNARVDAWLKEFEGFVKKKAMPRLMIIRLGNDHTVGTKKGGKTPRAMVAENDVALGRLIEALSHSRFWKETAVFVVEDDAQNGSDHVDAHRTVALVVSPYTRRGTVDSTMYSTTSMLRTMELILGLPPMSQHDAGAMPMTAAFADAPDPAPFDHRDTKIPFYEMNRDGAPMQALADTWDFSKEDAAPDIPLNEAIWKSVKGTDSDMPAPVNAAFVRVPSRAPRDD